MGEVKQSGGVKSEKEYATQSHYMDLNLFPDLFKDSGSVINESIFHNLSPYLQHCHYVISAYLKNNSRTV